MNKVTSAEEAVKAIKSGSTVATEGFVGTGFPEELAIALERRFLETGEPRDLTFIYAAGQGDGAGKGLNHFAHEVLVKRVIGGHWNLAPKMGRLALEGKIEAYNLPQGCISHLFRDIAGHRPGHITHVGLKTFVDPRNTGGKMNDRTTEDIVELVRLGGKEYLWYKSLPIDVALLRGTTADSNGNVSVEKEAAILEIVQIAEAVKNSGGKVIVQVERIAEPGSIPARKILLPGLFVDYVVQARPENHWQTFAEQFNPAYSGEIRIPLAAIKPLPLDERKIIGRRAAMELKPNSIINLGIGMPETVSMVASEENILNFAILTVEAGLIGGVPAGGLSFGVSSNFECIMDQPSLFDFYDGGGLDLAFLGLAQADQAGNVNVSKMATRFPGAGGFINITQNTKNVFFIGTFTAGNVQIAVENGRLRIIREGKIRKFVKSVEHITFSGSYAVDVGQPVLYITERAVFRLTSRGLQLIEVAPGVDIRKDILDQMEFMPLIPQDPAPMDERIFHDRIMNLRAAYA
ncbi:MAG: acyl CoA:acetate/3-ketoacid CoA transferase [Syntrophobacter sp.]